MRDVEWITDKVLMNVELTKRYNNVNSQQKSLLHTRTAECKIRILVINNLW